MHNGLDLLPKRCFRASRDQRSCVCKFVSEQVENVYGDCCYSGNLYEKSQFTVNTDQRKDSCARTSSVIMCWQSGARENQNYARHARDCKAKKACPMCKNRVEELSHRVLWVTVEEENNIVPPLQPCAFLSPR